MLIGAVDRLCRSKVALVRGNSTISEWRQLDPHLFGPTLTLIWGFPKIGVPLNHPFLDWTFHCKPSILGYYVESRPTAMLELYIDFALYTKTIVPLPVKPKGKKSAKCQYYLVDQNLEYAETEFKLSQQSFTWNRIVNWTRHHQCPIFPGEWVSQSGALKDLGNSFWVPAVKLTASLTTGALPYQKLHSIFVTPMGKKRKMCMPFRP